MELHEVRYFLSLAETLNFTKAARICHVAQPALTRAIQKLEHEFGGLLFRRDRNNIRLTELGRVVHPHLMAVMADSDRAQDSARSFLRSDAGKVRFGVMVSVGPLRFLPFFAEFRRNNPAIEIGVSRFPYERLLAMLLRGDLDVALAANPDGIAPPLDGETLYVERLAVALPHGHRLANRHSILRADIAGETLLLERENEGHDWVLSMVAAGLGVCLLPESSLPIPGVSIRPIVDPTPPQEVRLITVSGRHRSPPMAAFMQAVRQHSWSADAGDLS